MNYSIIKNNQTIPLLSIPVLDYKFFLEVNSMELIKNLNNHCVNYFGFPHNDKIKLICCIANDEEHNIYISSSEVDTLQKLPSLSKHHLAFEKFEREIHENLNMQYIDHPWLKPVRFPVLQITDNEHRISNNEQKTTIKDYPFFNIDAEELHEVGVGPIHAGVIEPGHFRFICNGEQIMHLEIQLGYQYRGLESLMLQKNKLLQRSSLVESIAGDTVIGHSTAFVNLWESLTGLKEGKELKFARIIALELERLAVHTGDISALCTDIAYQLGSAVFGRLRTPLINFFQLWCGNRLGKGLIRPGKINYPFTPELASQLTDLLDRYEHDFEDMVKELTRLPSVLARFEKTGVVSRAQTIQIGAVGMVARSSGLCRDIRLSHPNELYAMLDHQPVMKNHGDVYSRVQLRREEIRQSIQYIRKLLQNIPDNEQQTLNNEPQTTNDAFCLSLVEGWRGEICHCAITDEKGELLHYKIKDPSFHNWLALALAVRNNEISDFPVCNKSFNLSYCGHDL